MANEHFFPGEYFPSGLAAPFLGSSYAPPPGPGLDVTAAMSALGMPWADHQLPAADSYAGPAHFDSALSSLVSSPANAAGGGVGDDDVAIGDLIGRLGSICNGASSNNSCYSTPLSSPPRGAPQAFRGYAGAALESGRLSRVSSSKSLGGGGPAATAFESYGAEMSPKMAGNPAIPDPPAKGAGAGGEGPARKRKASAKGKAKETSSSLPVTAATNASPKRSKVAANGDKGGEDDAAADEKPEPPKDYIHVRARRGQATDSHSLAERVRRERISERMKMLQSLVPGCNKITGKALMLDEIVNYVQSLQRQVEFLSMKLATMNPQLDFDGRYLPPKDMNQTAMPAYPSDDPATAFSYTGSPADPFAIAAAHHGLEACNSFQPGGGAFCWEQDLQSIVHMGAASHGHGHGQDQQAAAPALPLPHPHGFYGQATVNHMKVEP